MTECPACIPLAAAAERDGKLGYVMCGVCQMLAADIEFASRQAAASPRPCSFCGGTHTPPDAITDDELRVVAEMMLSGRTAWTNVCRPGFALAHGVLRLLGRLDDQRDDALEQGSAP